MEEVGLLLVLVDRPPFVAAGVGCVVSLFVGLLGFRIGLYLLNKANLWAILADGPPSFECLQELRMP